MGFWSRLIGKQQKTLQSVDNRGWFSMIREPYAGAWQRNDEWSYDTAISYFAVFSCITLVAGDISKLRPRIVRKDSNDIWQEIAGGDILRRPNRYQNHIQFKESWAISKLYRGNTYCLKQRDSRGQVVALYVLDPERCRPLVADDGSIYYELSDSTLNGITQSVVVPASEIIHDRMNCLFHPLVGVPPLYACGLSAAAGQNMQRDSSRFFANGARPGGVLTAPGAISDETASRLKAHWDTNYTGENSGKVAVLGDGLSFQSMKVTAVDSELIDQMKLTADIVCSTFHVPPFKIGMGAIPSGQKIEDLNQIYYSDCLQVLIESMEECLTLGLELSDGRAFELDLDGLLRMDTATMYTTLGGAVGAAILAPNEARKRMNLKPLDGGDTVYMQQQDFPLDQVRKNKIVDAEQQPVAPAQPVEPVEDDPEDDTTAEDTAKMLGLLIEKELARATV